MIETHPAVRQLPAGHDDQASAHYVPSELRDAYQQLRISDRQLNELHTRLRRTIWTELLTDLWIQLATEKIQQLGHNSVEWLKSKTQRSSWPAPGHPWDPANLQPTSNTWNRLEERLEEHHRASPTGRLPMAGPAVVELTDEERATAEHEYVLRTVTAAAAAAEREERDRAKQVQRYTCQLCQTYDSATRPLAELGNIRACAKCQRVAPIVSALTEVTPSGTDRLTQLLDHPELRPRQKVTEAQIDEWLDDPGTGSLPAAPEAASSRTGLTRWLRRQDS